MEARPLVPCHMPFRPPRILVLLLAALWSCAAQAGTPESLTTIAEQSGFARTGRYDEVVALCAAFEARYPGVVRCLEFGTTPEGRPMKLLVASRTGALTPDAARRKGLPVVLVQGGIHAGEIDGKDAGFLALRDLLGHNAHGDILDRVVLLFVPVLNVDGHERFGAWNRPNQRGPEQMGWRTTAQNLNLNRDYLKADAPEMQAMLGLLGRWDPLAYVDLHVTDGAQFEHDVSIQVEPLHSGDAGLRQAGTVLRDATMASLAAAGSLPLPFYPSFVEADNPASGFRDGVATPRFSHGYMPLRNRLGMLVETHSWREYPHRVRVTRNTVLAVLELVARHGREWQALASAADAQAARLGGTSVALDYAPGDDCRTFAFRGYRYSRTPSEVSGALMTRYEEGRPETWQVPVCDDIHPSLEVRAPRGGYLVPAAQAAAVGEKLDLHGITYRRVGAPLPAVAGEVFRAQSVVFGAAPYEGRQRATLEGSWQPEARDLPAGSLYVPIAQPRARLLMALLEPRAPDSLASWGWFNNHFERKEYMEAYVAEAVAREALAADPALRASFEKRLREDPAFAGNPAARLDFFYRRHSAWDERHNLYPVMRIDEPPRGH